MNVNSDSYVNEKGETIMRSPLMLLTTIFFAFQAAVPSIAADDANIPPSWKAFATGSSVTVEILRKLPQAPADKSQTKTVLQKFEQSAFTRYGGKDGFKKAEGGSARDGTLPEKVGFKKVNRREEKITVAGKEYDSTVTTLSMEDRRGKRELIIWEVKELTLHTRTMGMPGPDLLLNEHVVKAQWTLSGPGLSHTAIQKVVKLKEKLTVGENTIVCLVEQLEASIDRRGVKVKATGENWTSEEVPGRAVKRTVSGTFSKDSIKWAGEQLTESSIVVDFEVTKKGYSN